MEVPAFLDDCGFSFQHVRRFERRAPHAPVPALGPDLPHFGIRIHGYNHVHGGLTYAM